MENLQQLRAICNVSVTRARELLEASNGSLDHAIDIFFHQQQSEAEQIQPQPQPQPQTESQSKTQSQQQHTQETQHREEEQGKQLTNPPSSPRRNIPIGGNMKRQASSQRGSPSFSNLPKQARLETFFKRGPKDGSSTESTSLQSKEFSSDKIACLNASIQITKVDNSCKVDGKESFDSIIGASTRIEELAVDGTNRGTEHLKPPKKKLEVKAEVSFHQLSETLQQMADTTKRLAKLEALKQFILHIIQYAEESNRVVVLTNALQLLLGIRSSTDQVPLQLSGSAVSKALQMVLGVSRSQLSKAYRQHGDLGDSAASFFQKKTFFVSTVHNNLSIVKVYNSIQDIAASEGRDAKQHILLRTMSSCQTKSELRFLVRLVIGNMRIGANLKTVLAALAMAIRTDKDESLKLAIESVQKVYDVCPNLEKIIGALLNGGFDQMKQDCRIQVLIPIAPMLAHPVHSLERVEKAMKENGGSIVMEWKYDGVRCQAHYDGTVTKLFSRHMLETSAQYPDAAKGFEEARKEEGSVKSFILDAEIVGVEGEGEDIRMLPFQDLSKRKRKDDGQGVGIKVFAFDLMYLNGVSYVNRPLWERQQALRDNFKETKDFAFVSSQRLTSYKEVEVRAFLEVAVHNGAEGLMLKMLGNLKVVDRDDIDPLTVSGADPSTECSPYEAGTRSHSWLKVKKDYVKGYADTIDVVPIGAWYGNGRKAKKSFLSPVLLAVYDEDEDVYRSISRCMSFTDAMYDAMREFYFRSTPYPSGVGVEGQIEEETDGNTPCLDTSWRDGVSVSEEDVLEKKITDSGDIVVEGEEMINCFPNRPSSAFVITNESPPIWFKPLEVFEVSFADMTLSRQHTAAAGIVHDTEGRGIALRFPRFKRRRPDKRPDQATTTIQIAELFANQSKSGRTVSRHGKENGD